MDGDVAPLRGLVELKEKYGAWLMVDEAHALGVLGQHGRGLADECGVSRHIEIQMGTLSKAVGASGGYICGSRALVDYLINRARSFIFSTAPVPAAAGAALAGVQLLQSREGEQRRQALHQRIHKLRGLIPGRASEQPLTAIFPVIVGDEARAVNTAARLRENNIFAPAVRYPTVARGAARLRISLTAAHSAEDLDALAQNLARINR